MTIGPLYSEQDYAFKEERRAHIPCATRACQYHNVLYPENCEPHATTEPCTCS